MKIVNASELSAVRKGRPASPWLTELAKVEKGQAVLLENEGQIQSVQINGAKLGKWFSPLRAVVDGKEQVYMENKGSIADKPKRAKKTTAPAATV